MACTVQDQDSLLDPMFVGPEAYCFTSGRSTGHTDRVLEVLPRCAVCQEREFDALEGLVLTHCHGLERLPLHFSALGRAAPESGSGADPARRCCCGCRVVTTGEQKPPTRADGGAARKFSHADLGPDCGDAGVVMKTPPWLMGAVLFPLGLGKRHVALGRVVGGSTGSVLIDADPLGIFQCRPEPPFGLVRCVVFGSGAAALLDAGADGLHIQIGAMAAVVLFPHHAQQPYGDRAKMPLSVFWWLLRRSPNSATARKSHNISYCYFAICMLAASSSTQANRFFMPA